MTYDKPFLYIDVDGVLFGFYDGYLQLRPNVNGFLAWATEHFRCRWLTTWGHDHLREPFVHTYGLTYFMKVRYIPWKRQCGGKARAIPWQTKHFYWIEDGIRDDEADVLRARGVFDRYIEVSEKGRDELDRVREILTAKLWES